MQGNKKCHHTGKPCTLRPQAGKEAAVEGDHSFYVPESRVYVCFCRVCPERPVSVQKKNSALIRSAAFAAGHFRKLPLMVQP